MNQTAVEPIGANHANSHHRDARARAALVGLVLVLGIIAMLRAQAPASAQMPPELEELLATAQDNGSVRVIVGLDAAFQVEGELAGRQGVFTQRQRIYGIQDAVIAEMTGSNARLIARFQYIPYIAFSVDAAALARLAALPQTTTFEEDTASPPALASSIPVIGADDAWAAGFTGSSQAVAILDTGVDKTHSFFTTGGSVVSEACYSTTYAPHGASSVCPGGVAESTDVGSGIDCTAAAAGFPDAVDGCRHGTHVAGIAAGDNGGANIGVARDANIIAVQIFSLFTGSNCGSEPSCVLTYSTDQIKGLERVYALRNTFNIAAVNMSIGGGDKQTSPCDGNSRKAAIDNLRSVDIATVISSGNNDWTDGVSSPGCISTAVTVGATEDDDDVASFSNVVTWLDLLAPGVSIISSVPGGGTASFQGTSMAAPHVTGAWAVVKQKAPSASVDDVLAAFRTTGTSVNDGRSGGSVTDMRRINLDLALAQFDANLVITKTVELADGPAQRGDPITYTIQVANSGAATATGVVITDTLPMYVDGTDLDTTATVTSGESVYYTLNASIAGDAPYGETITNTAHFSATSERGEASVAFTMEAATVALAITKTVELANEPSLRGDPVTYTIAVGNTGNSDATGVHITDTLPMYVEGSDLDTTATITAGDSVVYVIEASVATDAPYGETITNTAYYSNTSGNGMSQAVFAVAPSETDLSITKTVEVANDPALRGDLITYTIEVANGSGITATGVRITDSLPMYVDGPDLDTTSTITSGESVSYTLYATLAEDAPYGSTITNTAYYSLTSGSGHDSAAFSVDAHNARLGIVKTVALADEFMWAGDPLTYTVTVANSGSVTAFGVHITDTLPTYVIGTDLDTTTTVTAGKSVTYTISATMADGVPLGTTVTNTAYYDHASGRGESSAVFTVLASVYLPIVQK